MDFFEKHFSSNFGHGFLELRNQMESYNQKLVSIVKTLQLSPDINIEAEKNELSDVLDENIRKIEHIIEPLNEILKTKDSILEDIKHRIVDEISNLESIATANKWRRIVPTSFWSELSRTTYFTEKDAGEIIVGSRYVGPNDSGGYPTELKKIHELEQFNSLNTLYYEQDRRFKNIISEIQYNQDIIDNYTDFKTFADKVIQDFQNVIIIPNSDIIKCVRRGSPTDEQSSRVGFDDDRHSFPSDVIPSRLDDRFSFPSDVMPSRHDDRHSSGLYDEFGNFTRTLDTHSDIIFVIFENHDIHQYFGIDMNGELAIGHMVDYHITPNPPFCNFFIISDSNKFAEKILDIKTDTKKIILFENQFFKYADIHCFLSSHNHQADEFPNWREPCNGCTGRFNNEIQNSSLQNFKFTDYMLNPGILNTTRGRRYSNTVYPAHASLWYNFVSRFNESNNYNKKNILQQFKCLFTKDDNEEKILYLNLQNSIYPKTPLIELFLPEIKFLLHRILYHKFKIHDRFQTEWVNYVVAHNKHVNTPPQTFLHYLLNVVLSNLVPRDLYKSLLSSLGETTEILTKGMTSGQGFSENYQYTLIIKIIDKVLSKFTLNLEGGRKNKKSKSKIHKNKISRQKNNKSKISIQKNISKKHK